MIGFRFEECLRDAGVALTGGGREARLAPTVLFHNEQSGKLGPRDEITPTEWVKVLFDLPQPGKVREATLLWFVNQPPGDSDALWTILVNGHKITHQTRVARLLTGGWDRIAVPGRFLKAGRNEVVFAGYGWLYLDADTWLRPKAAPFSGGDVSETTLAGSGAGGHSLRSFDGGRTWHPNVFGPNRDRTGEYLVRLRVAGHPVAGSLTSPVADLGDPGDAGIIAPVMDIRSCRLEARQSAPAGTAVAFEMRSGSTPAFDPKSWSPWLPGARIEKPGRFVQWRATLSSKRLDATPVVSRVTLKPDVRAAKSSADDCRIAHWDRPELARSSYAFEWMAPNPRAKRLVQQFRLEDVIARGKTDLERLCLLRDWCWKQWFGWQGRDYPYCPSWNPFEILDTVRNNWGFGMCTHWSALYAACAGALGFHARILVIDHHCLNEVWVDELGKWILMDSAGDNNFIWELEGQPINALELHEAVRLGHGDKLTQRVWRAPWQPRMPNAVSDPKPVFSSNEFICKPLESSAQIYCRFGICLRNDYLVNPLPVEEVHGTHHYHWNGFLWWTDALNPKYPEHALQTQRVSDFYWTIGRVRAYLQRTQRPGALEARFEHAMPNFSHYEIKRGSGADAAWERAEECLDWELADGSNRLEVRAVSTFRHAGPPSAIEIIAARPKDQELE